MDEKQRRNQQKCLEEKLAANKQVPIQSYNGPLFVSNAQNIPDGVFYHKDFLNETESDRILAAIDQNDWANAVARRQQFYGEVYYHTTHDLKSIQPVISSSYPKHLDSSESSHDRSNLVVDQVNHEDEIRALPLEQFQWLLDRIVNEQVPSTASGEYQYKERSRSYTQTPNGIFTATKDNNPSQPEHVTQILVNEYRHRIGISSHIDDPDAFGKVLVMISLVGPVHMRLKHSVTLQYCDLLLEPRSMLILKGQARYEYQHGISHHRWVMVPKKQSSVECLGDSGVVQLVERNVDYRRISLTIRHLLQGRKQVKMNNHAQISPVGVKSSKK